MSGASDPDLAGMPHMAMGERSDAVKRSACRATYQMGDDMNRRELAYAAAGVLVGAAGCSGAARSLLVPEVQADQASAGAATPKAASVEQVHLLLSLGHPLARTQFFALNGRADYWTAITSDPSVLTIDTTRLQRTGHLEFTIVKTGATKIDVSGAGGEQLPIYVTVFPC